jgi:uncharacterized protein YndB with AHSA1/START domain
MQLGNVSDEAVKAKTGKDWGEWLSVLDAAGAQIMSHKQIVAVLVEQHQVPDWWCQMVTVGYEQARGLREKHQKTDGYSSSGSKTINASVQSAYQAWVDEKLRFQWMRSAPLEIRKATQDRSLRITWLEGKSSINVDFYPKGERKTQVSINHEKLPDQQSALSMKEFWKGALERLKQLLENG